MTRRSNLLIVALLALLCAAAVVLGWCASEAGAQGRTARWGGGILAGRSFPINESIQPWGPDGGDANTQAFAGAIKDGELFTLRYAAGNSTAGSQPIGHTGEDSIAISAFNNAYAGLCSSIPTTPGRTKPSAQEVWDFILTVGRWSAPYYDCHWKWTEGGTPERAIIVTSVNWTQHAARLTNPGGACELGPFDVAGAQGSPWRTHYDVRYLPDARPWCLWVAPAVGLRVEVEAFPEWLAGVVTRVSGTSVTIRLDAGGSRTEGFADEGRRWRRAGVQPQPTPDPSPSPTATPPPPVATPTPEPTPAECPVVECPTCPPCPPPVPKCAPLSARSRANLALMLDGTMVRASARLRLRRELASKVNCTVPGGGL